MKYDSGRLHEAHVFWVLCSTWMFFYVESKVARSGVQHQDKTNGWRDGFSLQPSGPLQSDKPNTKLLAVNCTFSCQTLEGKYTDRWKQTTRSAFSMLAELRSSSPTMHIKGQLRFSSWKKNKQKKRCELRGAVVSAIWVLLQLPPDTCTIG